MIKVQCYRQLNEKAHQKEYSNLDKQLKELFITFCEQYTDNYSKKLTAEMLVDIKCEMEKTLLKKYLLTGIVTDYRIHCFDFNRNLSEVSIVTTAYAAYWDTDGKVDELTEDEAWLYQGTKVKLPKELQIDVEDISLDFSECEKYRQEEAQYQADDNDITRTKACKTKKYHNTCSHFINIAGSKGDK